MLVIPAIDIRAGRCVRLYQGDFAQETRYDKDPIELACEYAQWGAPWLHVVDLDGAAWGRPEQLGLVEKIRAAAGLSVQLGGGIRSAADLETALAVVQRVAVGSLAISAPALVGRWLEVYGGDRLVLALDVKIDPEGVPRVATHGWTRDSTTSLWDCLERYRPHGLKHVLCTDVDRDGAFSGPNLELYMQFRERAPDVSLQASGGIRDASDLASLERLGLESAISGKALLEGRLLAEEIRPFLRSA